MDYFASKRFLNTLPDWETGTPKIGPLEHYLPRMQALLKRLDTPQQHFATIIVGGTNGKGTVSSLLAQLLQHAGHRVGLYSSPHLHTLRERIQVDGLLDKELWASGITHLYEKSRNFAEEGYGPFSKFEALTGLAAHLFAQAEVKYAIFEVGMGGRYDATNAWDAELAVLTAIDVDHVDFLGDDVLGIAADKLHIARPERPLFTTAAQRPEVLAHIRQNCRDRRIPLYVTDEKGIEGPPEALPVMYPCALEKAAHHSSVYRENAHLTVAVATHLLGDTLPAVQVADMVRRHHWPGRFEVAQERPLVLLDGAHNPAAAERLVQDLRVRAPQWTFVVGVNRGHDAAGILNALQPLARKVVLTQSEHPKAREVEVLRACAPSGLELEIEADHGRALRRALETLQEDDCLCVTGTLSLVARAREFLQLPYERDGVTEEVVLESLHCLELACGNRGLAFDSVSEDGNVLRLERGGRPLYFWRNHHPFNDGVGTTLAEDKAYQYELFVQAALPVPQTLQVFNPFADERFNRYKRHTSVAAIVAHVESQFTYPVVVKKNRGSMSVGVSLEQDGATLLERLQTLFENTSYFDNILLIQQYVQGTEYRIMASQDELLLAYKKQSDDVGPSHDLNPLHHASGRAVKVEEKLVLEEMRQLTRQLAAVIDLGFYAIDLIRDGHGFHILEINGNPICHFYNLSNGRQDFVRIYARLLEKYIG